MIYIISAKNADALKKSLGLDNKNTKIEILPQLPKGYKAKKNDQVCIDISGFDKKRFDTALAWSKEETGSAAEKRKKQKLPAGKFEGWKSVKSGTTASFFFLFVSISGKANLRAMLGEAGFTALKNRLRDLLQQNFAEADALLWMETEGTNLLLIPPNVSSGRAAVEAALKMVLNSPLVIIEKLNLFIPAKLTLALHYGRTIYQAPGKTGEVISEPVNYIFHLGTKRAETGRLTVSGDVPDEIIPKGLQDLFTPAGEFEGITIRESKRFVYK